MNSNILLNNNKYNFGILLLYFGTVATITAQFINKVQILYFISWSMLPLFLIYYNRNIYLNKNFATITFITIICVISSLILYIFSNNIGYINGLCSQVIKCYLVYLSGYLVGSYDLKKNNLTIFVLLYTVISLIYAYYIFTKYIGSYSNWLNSESYLYESKNKFGQIAGVGVILCIALFLFSDKVVLKSLSVLFGFALLLSAVYIQSRTAIIATLISCLVILIHRKSYKILLFVALLSAVCILLLPSVSDTIRHSFLVDKYAGQDINTFSSYRVEYWKDALKVIARHPAFGVGDYYVDCLYLNLPANFGIIGSIPYFALWFSRIVLNTFPDRSVSGGLPVWLHVTLVGLTTFYLLETTMEAIPPFGPGSSSFVFWLLSGFLDNRRVPTFADRHLTGDVVLSESA